MITPPQVQADPQLVKIIKEWVPVAKAESARCPHIFSGLATAGKGTAGGVLHRYFSIRGIGGSLAGH